MATDQTLPPAPPEAPAETGYVVLRRSDAEALNEEHAIFDDPFWRPVEGVTVTLPPCSCGSVSLYAEDPPRLGPHHAAACGRYRTPVLGKVAQRHA